MASIGAIRDALAVRLATIDGLHADAIWAEPVKTPCAIVMPEGDNDFTFERGHLTTVSIMVMVDAASMRVAQDKLDAYMSKSGTSSIQAAIEADPFLDGNCETVICQGWDSYGVVAVDDVQYLGSVFTVEVIHADTTAEIAALEARLAVLEAAVAAIFTTQFIGNDVFFGVNPTNPPNGTHAPGYSSGAIPPQQFWFSYEHHRFWTTKARVSGMNAPADIQLGRWIEAITGSPTQSTVALVHASGKTENGIQYRAGAFFWQTTQLTTVAGGTGAKWVLGTTFNGDHATTDRLTIQHDGTTVLTSDEIFTDFIQEITATLASGSQKGLKVDVMNNSSDNTIGLFSHNDNKVIEVVANDTIGLFKATPVGQAAAIANPSGDPTLAAIIAVIHDIGWTA